MRTEWVISSYLTGKAPRLSSGPSREAADSSQVTVTSRPISAQNLGTGAIAPLFAGVGVDAGVVVDHGRSLVSDRELTVGVVHSTSKGLATTIKQSSD